MASWRRRIALLFLAATLARAQGHSECDPTKKTCPPMPALGTTVKVSFGSLSTIGSVIGELAGTEVRLETVPGVGRTLIFPIETVSQAPTISTSKYMFFGRVDVELQAAQGAGIVTSIVMQSDDLDEIDWEWVGNDNAQVHTNYFSKGNTETYDRNMSIPVKEPLTSIHTYSIVWTTEKLEWLVDGVVVRTVPYVEADNGKPSGFPQSPMLLKLGTWVAGQPTASQGTIDWAGGLADFSKAPFNAYLKTITIDDYAKGTKNATQYRYLDKSGLYQNIRAETVEEARENDRAATSTGGTLGPTGVVLDQNSNAGGGGGLGAGAIAGIVAGFVAAAAVIGALIFVLLRQKRKREKTDNEKPDTPAVDEDKAIGVDAKMELDGNTFAEMDALAPPPKEMDGTSEMRKELDGKHTELRAEMDGGIKDDDAKNQDVKEEVQEIYELMVHEPGDELIPDVHELELPSPLTPSQHPASPTLGYLPSPLSPESTRPARSDDGK
ncbi:hypothetical protein OQA88_2136 [Cercophora sp. LCS_1]